MLRVSLFSSTSKNQHDTMKILHIEYQSIRGYYFFKRRPHTAIEMQLEKEEDKSYDVNAMVIKMPDLIQIDTQYLNITVRPCKGKEPEQKVKDNAGKVIGRVPANISMIFKELITSNQVKKITCMSTDNPNISKVPPSRQYFRKNQDGFDRRGGGGIIPCQYIIYCCDSTFEKLRNILHESLKELKFQGTEKLFIPTEEDELSRSIYPW